MKEEIIPTSFQPLIAMQPCKLPQYIFMHWIDIGNPNSSGSFGLLIHAREETSPDVWTKGIEEVKHVTLGKVIIQRVNVQHRDGTP